MNHIYRLCWNRATSQWVAASELARASRPAVGNRTTRIRGLALTALALSISLAGIAHAGSSPAGGQVVAGTGTITHNGATTTINQASQKLSLNWQSFDVAHGQSVNFVQPGSSAVAVNRILGNTASQIFGNVTANGQVWLINPNGMLFGKGSQVNVGGIVASTLDTSDASIGSGTQKFSGPGKGSIVNQGSIHATGGGYVAMLGNRVSNQGTITANLGTVALGAGSAVTLSFGGNQLLHVQVDQSTLDNLAENGSLIQADGGRVIMTAGAADSLLASTVNNTGVVRAQTVESHNGVISLIGGAEAGQVNVAGTLDASAPHGGNGGSIETSAAQAHIAGDANITAAAPAGKAGTWLVDPTDLTIDTAAATTISASLNGGTSVTEQTTASGATGAGVQTPGAGDITVNAAINWSNAASTLTLLAYHGINVNSAITGTGKVVLTAGTGNIALGANGQIAGAAGVTLSSGANFINGAGANALSATAGRWLVYSTNPTLDTTGGLTPTFIQYNANTATALAAAGSGFVYTVAPTIKVTGLTGTIEKTYDGTIDAAFAAANLAVSGLIHSDKITSASGGTYASSDAATGIMVTSPTSVSGFVFRDASGSIPVYGYQLNPTTVSANIGVIDPKQLTVGLIGDVNKTYDGTTTATLTSANYDVAGVVAGQSVTVNQPSSVAYAGSNAGSEQINATFAAQNFVAGNGTKLKNYILPTAFNGAMFGTINRANVQITGLLATDKTYDGTTTDTLNTASANLFGVISNDTGNVQLDTSAGTGTFASANAGNTIAVTASGFTLTGNAANNYTLVAPSGLSANIDRRALTIGGLTAASKVYDTTSAAMLAGTAVLNNTVSGDDITLTGTPTARFGTANVGNGLGIAVSGYTLGGSALANYTLVQPSGFTANITPAPLTITLIGDPTRIYNGTNSIALTGGNFSITGFKGTEGGSVTQVASGSYDDVNAATNVGVTAAIEASDISTTGGASLSNYSFSTQVTGVGTISPITLTGSIVGNPTKVYDGTTSASLTSGNYQLGGFLAGESITATKTSGTYATADAGQRAVTANLAAADYTAASGTLLSNYVLPAMLMGVGTITPAPLGGTNIFASISGDPTRFYDGTTVATIAPGDFTLTGFMGSDGATVAQLTGAYASKNVGRQAVSVNLTDADFTPTGTTDLNNYTLPSVAYGTGTINPVTLTASIINNPTKVYDGTTNALLPSSSYQFTGFVAGEGATVAPPSGIAYNSKNVDANSITAQLASSSYMANSGTLLSNYVLATSATGAATITAAPLYIIGVSAQDKTYDGTNGATLNVGGATLQGLVDADAGNVTLTSPTTGLFSQSNVGAGLAVTPSTFTIAGGEASNYALVQPSGLMASITARHLQITGVSVDSRVYDGTTAFSLIDPSAALTGIVNGDMVTLDKTNAAGAVRSANVGTNLAVTVSGFSLDGTSSGNYVVDQPGGLTANITPRPITASIIGNPIKAYDGTTSATLTAADYSLSGFIGSDNASVPQSATASYATQHVGTNVGLNSTLVVSDFVPTGSTNLSNYLLPTTGTGNGGGITAAIINLQGTRVYDATMDAAATLFGNGNGTIAGVNGETLALSGNGNLTTKNVGTKQPFLDTGSLVLGNGTGMASDYTFVGGIDWVTITPYQLTVTGTQTSNKVYDGTTRDTLSNATLTGVFNGDTVNLGNAGTGTFSDKNVGTGKTVTTNMTISGGDAGNYTLLQPTGLMADITALHIIISATGIDKVYDGNTNALVKLTQDKVVAGDRLVLTDSSASFASKNVSAGTQTVTVNGVNATGADAGNYVIDSPSTLTTTAMITPKVLDLTGTRVYDATAIGDAAIFTPSGTVSGETASLSGAATLPSKNVTTGETFVPAGLSLVDNGAFLASNYTLVNGIDKVTITPAMLFVTGASAHDKTYDGTTSAKIDNTGLSGVLGADAVTIGTSTGTFDTKNVGNDKAVTASITLANPTGDAKNYILVEPTGLTADITPKQITAVQATGIDKVYDGTTTAGVMLDSTDRVAGDDVVFTPGASHFVTSHVDANGNPITINVTGITDSGADAGNYLFLPAASTATTSALINPYLINLQGTRVYDGTATGASTLFGTGGVVNGIVGQTLSASGTAVLVNKNVGDRKAFTPAGEITLTGLNGALASDYGFGPTNWVTITPLAIVLSASDANKVYDTTTATTANITSAGVLPGDMVNFAGTATFADANAGNGKQLNVTGITGSGADVLNYSFATTLATTADITPYVLSLVGTRVYDAMTDVDGSVFGTNGVVNGIGGQTLQITGATTTTDKNVGSGKMLTSLGTLGIGGIAGSLASNYTLIGGMDSVSITPKAITGTIVAADKTYDGSTTAITRGTLSGVFAGDDLGFDSTGHFVDKNAAQNKTVNVAGSLNGADLGNYTLTTNATTTATILPLVLNLAGTRVYDGLTDAAAGLFAIDGVLNGESITLNGTGVAASKNVTPAVGLASIAGFSLTGNNGTLASNYTLVGGTDVLAITPLTITGAIVAANRTYDGLTDATTSGTLTGYLQGDDISLITSGAFRDKNAANGKTVDVTGTLAGSDAGNYLVVENTTTTANITPLAITGSIVAADKTYDGTTAATTRGTLSGVLAGDQLGLATAGTFTDKNAAAGKTVNVRGALTGADLGNYTLSTNATTTAAINQVVLNLTGTRVYDGTTSAAAGIFGNAGMIAGITGETLGLSGSGILPSKNVATGEALAGLGTLALNDQGGALASNYTLLGGRDTATITPLTINGAIAAADKAYNGKTTATTSGALTGVLAGDEVAYDTSGNFTTKNVGSGKTVNVVGTLSGTDAANYAVIGNVTTKASISPLQITVDATGTTRYFDGTAFDIATLRGLGVIPGDQVSFGDTSVSFADAASGDDKTVTIRGIFASGADAGNYSYNTTATTTADILPISTEDTPAIAAGQVSSMLDPNPLATPFGTASSNTVGQYTGNHKMTREEVEANAKRDDFYAGLALHVIGGGVAPPADAMQ